MSKRKSWQRGSMVLVAAGTLVAAQGCASLQRQPPADPPVGAAADEIVPMPVVTAPKEVPPPAPKPIRPATPIKIRPTVSYTVQQGDTLSLIAQMYGIRVAEITELNRGLDPKRLRVGKTLLLPPHAKKRNIARKAPKPAAPHAQASAAAGAGEYVIKPGDSLSKIAVAHGVTQQALREANGMTNDKLVAGKKLVIPGGAKAPAAPAAPAAPVAPAIPVAPAEPAVPADPGLVPPGGMAPAAEEPIIGTDTLGAPPSPDAGALPGPEAAPGAALAPAPLIPVSPESAVNPFTNAP